MPPTNEGFKALFRLSPLGILVSSASGVIEDANEAAVRFLGFAREELLGHTSLELGFIDPDARARLFDAVRSDGLVHDVEIRVRAKGGDVREAIVSVQRLELDGVPQFITTFLDVTERNRAARQERSANARFSGFLEAAPDAIVIIDRAGIIVRVNAQTEKMFGYAQAELVGQSLEVLLPARFRERHLALRAAYSSAPIARRMGGNLDLSGLRKDGVEFPVEIALSPLQTEDESLICSVIRDVSERRHADTRFRAAIDALTDAFFLEECERDANGKLVDFRLVDANGAALRRLRRDREGFIGERLSKLTAPHLYDSVFKMLSAAIHEQCVKEHVLDVRSEGLAARWVRQRAVPVPPDGLFIISEDITLEREQQEASARLVAIVESSDDAIISESLDGVITSWNRGAERMFGYGIDEILGQRFAILLPPDRVAEYEERLKRIGAGERVAHFEATHRTRDGRLIIVSTTASPVRDERDRVALISKVMRDVTAAKQAERALRDSLKEKEVLLQEVHHRVKNNLQIIASLINMQLRTLEGAAARSALEECQSRVMAIALIHQKLYQSHDYANVPFYEYLRSLVRSVVRALGSSADKVALNLNIESIPLPVDKAIPCGLMVNEMITNALKHAFPSGRRGTVRVELTSTHHEVHLCVGDDGVGLPSGFNFRDARTLGMHLIAILADQLGARVDVEGDRGAMFRVTFSIT